MSFHVPPYLNLFQKKKASLIICHLEQHPVNWLFQIQANEFNFPNPVGAQNTGVLIFVGRHCIKKRYYGRNSSAYKWKSTADREEKGLYHCLEEEDGVSLENWKLWHLKGKKERKPHANPIFPVVVSPESLFSRFSWFTSLSQKPVTQPLL